MTDRLRAKIRDARLILARAVARHQPCAIYACVSGGGDSMAMASVTMDFLSGYAAEPRILHINTGIGIEKTREFVRETCPALGWGEVVEVHAKEDCGQDYEQMMMEYGFPGPGMHTKMYNRLKQRPIELVARESKEGRHSRVLFVSGVRRMESNNRMGIKKAIDRRGSRVWVNPLLHWSGHDCHQYRKHHDIPVTPVHEELGMSGECECGAYAQDGELKRIEQVEPETAERIREIERKVQSEENPYGAKPWGWEDEGPPLWYLLEQNGQLRLPFFRDRLRPWTRLSYEEWRTREKAFRAERQERVPHSHTHQPMCVGCGKTA